jgi:hypothetical protein
MGIGRSQLIHRRAMEFPELIGIHRIGIHRREGNSLKIWPQEFDILEVRMLKILLLIFQ